MRSFIVGSLFVLLSTTSAFAIEFTCFVSNRPDIPAIKIEAETYVESVAKAQAKYEVAENVVLCQIMEEVSPDP